MHWNIDALSDVSLQDAPLGNGLVHLRKVFHDLRHQERRHSCQKCAAAPARFLPRRAACETSTICSKISGTGTSRRLRVKLVHAVQALPCETFTTAHGSTRTALQALQSSQIVLLLDVAFWKTVTMYCGWKAPLPPKPNHPRQHNFVFPGYEVLGVKNGPLSPGSCLGLHTLYFSIGSRIAHHKRHNTKPFLYLASGSTTMHCPLADASMLHTREKT